jgi:hypothetical protein
VSNAITSNDPAAEPVLANERGVVTAREVGAAAAVVLAPAAGPVVELAVWDAATK